MNFTEAETGIPTARPLCSLAGNCLTSQNFGDLVASALATEQNSAECQDIIRQINQ